MVSNAEARDGYTPRVNQHQRNQHTRIQHGVHNGQLTRHESRALRLQQAKIRHYKHMAMVDGRISPRERQLLHHEQRKANRNIYRSKHNARHY